MSYDNYLPTLEAHQVHIGIQNPQAYITLVKTRGAYALAKMVELGGNSSYRGLIIARQDRGIRAVSELKGRTVAASSRRAVGGFLAQALACRHHGIDINRDLELILVGTQDAVINAVYRGKADAGFVREDALELAKNKLDLSRLATISYTDYYPTWCVAAFANTPPNVSKEIASILLSLDRNNPEHEEVLKAIGIAGFQEVNDSDYDIVRKAMDGLNLPY